MLSASLARSTLLDQHLCKHDAFASGADPLDALDALLATLALPAPDAHKARALIKQARVQQAVGASTNSASSTPPSYSHTTTRSASPFESIPTSALTYRASHDTSYQGTRTYARNHTPIAVLPDDVLLYIFEYVAGGRSEEPEKRLSWLIVTFVCRYWRHVAVASPSLWDRIPVRSADLLVTFAKRARDLPLDLVFEGSTNKANMLAAARRVSVYHLGSRIRSLHFLDRTMHWMEFARCLPSELPRLEVLQLDGMEYWSDSTEDTPVGQLLGEDAPALRTLSVTGCSFLPNLYLKCTKVTNLRLARNANFLGPDAILDILRNFPDLRTFHFEMRTHNEEIGALEVSEHDMVSLPQLESLTIVHVPRVAAHILAHLSFPANTTISLGFPTADGHLLADHTSSIFTSIPDLAKHTHLSITVHEKAGKVSVHAGKGFGDRRFSLQYKRDYNFDQHFENLGQIMPNLTTLSVDLDSGRQGRSTVSSISESSWRRFLARLLKTEELRVSSNCSFSHRALFRVLRDAPVAASPTSTSSQASATSTDDEDPRVAKVCLPALRTLQFRDLVLNEDKCFCGCMEDGLERGTYGECSIVDAGDFFVRKDAWEHDYEFIDSAAMWIEGLRRCVRGRAENGARPLTVRVTAESFRKWRASSCHHPEIARAIEGVARLEYGSPGN